MVFSEKDQAVTENKYEKREMQIWSAYKLCKEYSELLLLGSLLLKLLYESIWKQAIWKGKWVELAINNDNGGQPNGNWWHDLLLKRVWDTHVPSWHCN